MLGDIRCSPPLIIFPIGIMNNELDQFLWFDIVDTGNINGYILAAGLREIEPMIHMNAARLTEIVVNGWHIADVIHQNTVMR